MQKLQTRRSFDGYRSETDPGTIYILYGHRSAVMTPTGGARHEKEILLHTYCAYVHRNIDTYYWTYINTCMHTYIHKYKYILRKNFW